MTNAIPALLAHMPLEVVHRSYETSGHELVEYQVIQHGSERRGYGEARFADDLRLLPHNVSTCLPLLLGRPRFRVPVSWVDAANRWH
jgi:hypothetical protein